MAECPCAACMNDLEPPDQGDPGGPAEYDNCFGCNGVLILGRDGWFHQETGERRCPPPKYPSPAARERGL